MNLSRLCHATDRIARPPDEYGLLRDPTRISVAAHSARSGTKTCPHKTFLRALLISMLLMGGCVHVPEEAVVLSEDVGGILEELRQRNSNLITQVFAHRKGRVNEFIDQVYAPAVVKDAIDKSDALNTIADEVNRKNVVKALGMMEIVVRQSRERIERTRQELVSLVEAQEQAVRDAFDASFGIAMKGTETTTGLLRSIRAVHNTQERLLGSVGIEKLRETVNEQISDFSGQLDRILADAERVDEQMGTITVPEELSLEEAGRLVDRIKTLLSQ